jgi:hypothetical protein
MDAMKKKRLEENGWKVGSIAEFLDLTVEETTLVEITLALSHPRFSSNHPSQNNKVDCP